jgi:hypothetical protein
VEFGTIMAITVNEIETNLKNQFDEKDFPIRFYPYPYELGAGAE